MPTATEAKCRQIQYIFEEIFAKIEMFLYLYKTIKQADTFGSDYFVYDAGDTTCTLIDGGDSRTCSSITGPAFPDFEDECVGKCQTTLKKDSTCQLNCLY